VREGKDARYAAHVADLVKMLRYSPAMATLNRSRARAGWGAAVLHALLAALLVAGCNRGPVPGEMSVIPAVSEAEWSIVAKRRVLFAHQSVGQDILDGVAALAARQGIDLNIVQGRSVPPDTAGIYHFSVGENGDPVGKLRDFRDLVDRQGVEGIDMVMVKLCYVDFTAETDASGLAGQYVSTLRELQARHPGARFIAVTAPLTTVQGGPKAWVKRLLGKQPYGVAENARREEFNQVVRSSFPRESLFDLARLELGEGVNPSLDPRLTYDGGHLNEFGQALVGAAFIKAMATDPVPR
jgi:hypothetical protein